MTAVETKDAVQILHIEKDVLIAAPLDIVFETVLGQAAKFGPAGDMNLKLEAWPGGRWYRDLGNNTGHFWGHVQVIKPPKLLELVGPMFMSYPVASHLQYRLTEEGKSTRLKLTHRAIGLIPSDHMTGVNKGWEDILGQIKMISENGKK